MKQFVSIGLLLLAIPLLLLSQNTENQRYKSAFQAAYEACPEVPRGMLEAVSFTNTQCHHLTDDNYFHEGPEAMPRAYGLMGLVKDGKGYFRENLSLVAALSGIPEQEILQSPEKNVLAYAKAFNSLAKDAKVTDIGGYLFVIQQLSELPVGEEKDVYPMQSMLYSVCLFLKNEQRAEQYGFSSYDIDLERVFSVNYDMLVAPKLGVGGGPDYPPAIWVPAPECNWEPRTKEVSAVVIHYTEGSYAGCISWFQNCESQVSAHYVIRSADGQVTQMVREQDKAWHARSANGYTIGIEHEAYGNIWSFFTDAMYRSSANLVRSICSRYETIDGLRTFYRDTLDSGICLNEGLHDLGGEEACTKIRGHQHYPDQSHTDPGPFWDWNYYYKLINEGTPVTVLQGEGGRLDHQHYGNDERRIWVIRGPENTGIQLDFNSFDLEADYDFLWVYDGDNVYAPKIGRWNTQSPGKVRSSSNVMCVEFRSDCAELGTGWTASWSSFNNAQLIEDESNVSVLPNPIHTTFTVRMDNDDKAEVVVYDLYGNQMLPLTPFMEAVTIDASHWPSGVYVVRYGNPSQKGRVVRLVKL